MFHHRLFAVKASAQPSTGSRPTAPVPASMVSGPTEPGEKEAASTLEALASARADWQKADLERLQAAKR